MGETCDFVDAEEVGVGVVELDSEAVADMLGTGGNVDGERDAIVESDGDFEGESIIELDNDRDGEALAGDEPRATPPEAETDTLADGDSSSEGDEDSDELADPDFESDRPRV